MDGIYSRISLIRKLMTAFYDIIRFVRQYLPNQS